MAIREFPKQRPFLRNNAAFFRELRPGVATLPHSAPILADAFEAGTETLPETPQLNADLADVFDTLADFSEDPLVRGGVTQLTRLSSSLRPTLRFLTPVQTTCNYATLFFRNASSVLSQGDPNGNWQRFTIIPTTPRKEVPPIPYQSLNNEIGPSTGPANGPGGREPPALPTRTRTRRRRGRRRSARPATSASRRSPARRSSATSPATRASRPARTRTWARADEARRQKRHRLTAFQAGLITIVVIAIGAYLGFTKDIPFTQPVPGLGGVRERPADPEGHRGADRGRGRGQGVEGRAAGRRTRRA